MSASRRLLMVCLDVASGIFFFFNSSRTVLKPEREIPLRLPRWPTLTAMDENPASETPGWEVKQLTWKQTGSICWYVCIWKYVCVCLCLWVHLSIDLRVFLWSLMLFSNLTLRYKLPPTALEPSTANPRVQPVCWHHRSDMKKQLRTTCACSATLSDKHTLLQETLLRLYMFFCTGLSFQI